MGLESRDTVLMCNHHPSPLCYSFSLMPSCSNRCFPSAPRSRGPCADELITQISIQQPRGRGRQGKHTSISRSVVKLSPSVRDSPWELNHKVMAAVRRGWEGIQDTPNPTDDAASAPGLTGEEHSPQLSWCQPSPAKLNSCRSL